MTTVPDLRTRYLGLDLAVPIVASPSPLTGRIDQLRRLEAAGAGAVVLPSLFEEQVLHDAMTMDRLYGGTGHVSAEADGWFPELDGYNDGTDRYLALVERAKSHLSIPVIASLNGTTPGALARYAHLVQAAGADAVELNLYVVAADVAHDAVDVEARARAQVEAVRAALDIPLAVKVGPFFSAFANAARSLASAGADGLVLFNRFYQPDIDLETLEVSPRLTLSTSDDLRLPLRWTAILRGQVHADLALSGGVHTGSDAAKAILAGADVVMMASALLRHGPEHVAAVVDRLRRFLSEHAFESVDDARGLLRRSALHDGEAYERACYLRVLLSHTVA